MGRFLLAISCVLCMYCTELSAASPRHEASHSAAPPVRATIVANTAMPAAVAPTVTPAATGPASQRAGASSAPGHAQVPLAQYPWIPIDFRGERLSDRFVPPSGYTRVAMQNGSFAAFLRDLPLSEIGANVVSFRGDTIVAAGDPRIAAVVALDVGSADLQHCADSIIRLDAEWRFGRGERTMQYAAVSGDRMGFEMWASGKRMRAEGNKLLWTGGAKVDASYASFRKYLDTVFSYASTISLSRDASSINRAALAPGDFWVSAGSPGHTVLLLDMAVDASGHKRGLIGQGYMTAQSFQVLAHDGNPWFSLDDEAVGTPFWRPFAWNLLRRFP
jgi:Domain of unknown function (4846)